jgi:hypothetical protein
MSIIITDGFHHNGMSDVYTDVKAHFADDPEVEVLKGRGAQGIKRGGKMFVMFMKGDLVVKLPENRVKEVIDSVEGEPFDPGTGKPMKNRVLIPVSKKETWIKFCEEAKEYA